MRHFSHIKRPVRIILFLGLMLACLQAELRAQSNTPLRVGIGLTGYMYRGDLTDDNTLHRIYPGLNFSLQSAGRSNLQMQLNAGFGKFSEQYDSEPPPLPDGVVPVNFVETSFFYGDLRVKYRLFRRKAVQPYGSIGAGFLIFSPKDKNGKFLSDAILTRPAGETYNTAVPQIPMALGFQVRITPLVWASLDYTYRFTPTDYLDNIGELGTRKGNDELHAVQLSLYFQISGREEAQWESMPEERIDPLILGLLDYPPADTMIHPWDLSTQPIDSSKVAPSPEEKVAEAGRTSVVQSSLSEEPASLIPDLDQYGALLIPPMASPGPLEGAEFSALSYWDSLAWEALQRGEIFYYRAEDAETYDRLSERFYVSADMLRDINEVEDENLSSSIQLVVPDLRKWIKDWENENGISETPAPGQEKWPEPVAEVVALQQQNYWLEKEEEALVASRYVYYQVKPTDTLANVASRYKTRVATHS